MLTPSVYGLRENRAQIEKLTSKLVKSHIMNEIKQLEVSAIHSWKSMIRTA